LCPPHPLDVGFKICGLLGGDDSLCGGSQRFVGIHFPEPANHCPRLLKAVEVLGDNDVGNAALMNEPRQSIGRRSRRSRRMSP
jgi:hypothetical protein